MILGFVGDGTGFGSGGFEFVVVLYCGGGSNLGLVVVDLGLVMVDLDLVVGLDYWGGGNLGLVVVDLEKWWC